MNKQIVFSKKDTAELWDIEYKKPGINQASVETHFSAISSGTEKANITGNPNISSVPNAPVIFPRYLGYSSAGIVKEVGENVTHIAPGDRVIVFHGQHKKYNTLSADNVVKIPYDDIPLEEAALIFITTFPLAAIRKTRLEISESALVMGLGILGQFAIKFLKAAGAAPIIAADLLEERRQSALSLGADYAFDPADPDFAEKVKNVSGGGVNVCIEVTGVGAGLDSALDCMARFGRVALLGCTRDKNFTIDYYKKIHWPGITLIGAHTQARPDQESHQGYYTHRDDILATLKLLNMKRITLSDMVKEVHSPKECGVVYERLINEKNFPCAVLFDWRDIK